MSAEQYTGPTIRPGELVSFISRDGVMYTERYAPPEPVILERPTGWRAVLRWLTPPWWRRPLPVKRNDPLSRYHRMLEGVVRGIDELTKRR